MKIVNFGSMNLDHVYAVSHFVKGGETLAADSMKDCVGGKGLNQSLAVARSGASIYHAGMLGDGGELLRDCLKKSGVDVSLIERCGAPQGHTAIQVTPDGLNCILVFGGSNQQIDHAYIDRVLARFVPGDYLMLQNEISCLEYLLSSAASRGLKIVLNASPIDEALLRLPLEHLEWLVVNEIECAAIAGIEDPMQAYRALQQKYPNIGILLTLGADGSVCWKDGCEYHQTAFPVRAVDTTGAGDTFVGYFIGYITQGMSIQETMRTASAASAISVTLPGAADSIPWMRKVRAFIDLRKVDTAT